MNKRQKKKQLKRYIQKITKNWKKNVFFKVMAEQLMTGEVVDVGIRIGRPEQFKARRLGK